MQDLQRLTIFQRPAREISASDSLIDAFQQVRLVMIEVGALAGTGFIEFGAATFAIDGMRAFQLGP